MDVVVWALWIWIACSAVALVMYVLKRVRYNRRQRNAVLKNEPLPVAPTKPEARTKADPLSASAKKLAEANVAKPAPPPLAGTSESLPVPDALKGNPVTSATDDSGDPASTGSGLFSMSSLLAPRADEPQSDTTKAASAAETNADTTHDADTAETKADTAHVTNGTAEADGLGGAEDDTEIVLGDGPNADATPGSEVTLADLLAGVRLPCDLLPVDGVDPEIADVAVTLVTESEPPETVGVSLADELERLGYEIFSTSDSEAVAKRNVAGDDNQQDLLSLHIRTNVDAEGNKLADNAEGDESDGTVAVDIWVGDGACPLPTGDSATHEKTRLDA